MDTACLLSGREHRSDQSGILQSQTPSPLSRPRKPGSTAMPGDRQVWPAIMNLSTKLILIFSSIILLMGSVSFYGIYSFQYDILTKEIAEKLENVALAHLDGLDRMFFERLDDLGMLSEAPVIASRNSTPAQIQAELEKFRSRHPYFVSVSYFDMERVRVASAGSMKDLGVKHSLNGYWAAVYEGKDRIVNISASESLQAATVHLVSRVKDDKGSFGVLVARIPVEGLYDWLEVDEIANVNHKLYKVVIMDKDGLVLYSNYNQEAILKEVDNDFDLIKARLAATTSAGSQALAPQKNYLIEPDDHNHAHEEEILAFAKERGYQGYKGNGWILKIEVATKDAFAPLAALGKEVSILLGVVFVISALVITYALLYTVIRPLEKLSNATARLGEGCLDTKLAVESKDEIGRLAESFNLMASNLHVARERLAQVAEVAMDRASMAEREIIHISENTQQRIGQELHDDLGQQLTGIAFMSEVLFQNLKKQDHPDLMMAAKITSLINEAILKTRKLAYGLYPVELKGAGLPAMLGEFTQDIGSIYGIRCDFACRGSSRIDDLIAKKPDIAIHLYRIAQESVNNAIKHGAATEIQVRLASMPDSITLEISDNGKGIADLSDADAKEGLGMRTMQYRASLIGAVMHINPRPEGGTSVTLTLPVQHEA